MKNPLVIFLCAGLLVSIGGNVCLWQQWQNDEARIEHAKQVILDAQNAYRAQLIQLKAEHPIIFKDLQIPPAAN
jgi:hypothetical protein